MTPKIIWITGGSSGIGFATAKHYLQNNWIVVISSSNNEKLQKAKERLQTHTNAKNLYIAKCDITNQDEVKKTISFIENEIGTINTALLNAAAYSPNKNQEFDIKYMGDVQNCGYMDLEIPDYTEQTGEIRDTVYLG